VLLAPGTFQLAGSLTINTSGVVLRGSGSDQRGTVLQATGSPRRMITIAGTGKWQMTGTTAVITDSYVPAGARSFHVNNAAGLAVGATVLVNRAVSAAWVKFMGMNTLVRNGQPQVWLKPGQTFRSDRVITAVQGNQITIDAPLSDSIDAAYLDPSGATVTPYSFNGRIAEVGLEHLHVVVPGSATPINQATYELVSIDAAINGWIDDVVGDGFINGMSVGGAAKWVTIEKMSLLHTAPIDGSSGFPADYSIGGQQILIDRSASTGDHVFSVVTQAMAPGPNVVLNLTAKGVSTNLAPHQRWATGLLLDNIDSPTGGINLMNRNTAGSGQGWAIGFAVAWNGTASTLLVQQPPGATNWAIGMNGNETKQGTIPIGTIDSPNQPVAPRSLYLAQLCERLGPAALKNIGY
jgi:hypothetical protein